MRGALWALGTLAVLGGVGIGVLSIMAAAMSDVPSNGQWPAGTVICAGVAILGVAMIAGGFAF